MLCIIYVYIYMRYIGIIVGLPFFEGCIPYVGKFRNFAGGGLVMAAPFCGDLMLSLLALRAENIQNASPSRRMSGPQ